MPYPLLLRTVLERALTIFPEKEIISRDPEGLFRYNYGEMYRRTQALAGGLEGLGIRSGDRVASFAWNNHRHLELYFGVPCMGAVLHTVNIRLFPEQVSYIINHAEDQVLFIDPDLVPAIEAVAGDLKTVRHYVILCDRAGLPATSLKPVHAYEDLVAGGPSGYEFPSGLDENSPAVMCYTSATTGNPKGVVYTHRTIYLHTSMLAMADTLGVSERDTVMPVVPMFHVNAWGLPWSSTFMGARQVLPGTRPDARVLGDLIQRERVTLAAGVPTIWMGVLELVEQEGLDLSSLRALVVGGAAAPQSLIEAYEHKASVPILHAYGMTESASVTHVGRLKRRLEELSEPERYRLRAKQGLLAPGLEMRVVEETGADVARDGRQMGEVLLRGPYIATEYYRDARSAETFIDGWYHSGDVATVDPDGYVEIADRTKDLVRSGGEWISSVDLENQLMAHPAVREAAVIAVPHPRWQERPVACVVLREGQAGAVDEAALLKFLESRFARWWLPDRVVFIDDVPKTSVGKFDKKALRARFQDLLEGPG